MRPLAVTAAHATPTLLVNTLPSNRARCSPAISVVRWATASRQRLEGWMAACTTGRNRLRAGLPADWAAGDKTGSGELGTVNDVAILRPPHRAPVFVAVYYTGSTAPMDARNAVLAEVGRIVVAAFRD